MNSFTHIQMEAMKGNNGFLYHRGDLVVDERTGFDEMNRVQAHKIAYIHALISARREDEIEDFANYAIVSYRGQAVPVAVFVESLVRIEERTETFWVRAQRT